MHKELGKLADLAGDRARALDEYRAGRAAVPRRTTTGDCSDDAKSADRNRPIDETSIAIDSTARTRWRLAGRGLLICGCSRAHWDARTRRRAVARRAGGRGSTRTSATSLSSGIRADPRPEAERRRGAVRFHVPDLPTLGVDSAVAVRQQSRHAGGRRRRGHDRRRQGRPRAVARQPARAGVRHGAERRRDRRAQPLKWTVNCLVCHTAEIDGVAYFGAGTKTFDDSGSARR